MRRREDEDRTQGRMRMASIEHEANTVAVRHKNMDEWVRNALACPCVDELKQGPCGEHFERAFTCFAKSNEEEKGSDCVRAFQSFQFCMAEHPEAFENMIEGAMQDECEGKHQDDGRERRR